MTPHDNSLLLFNKDWWFSFDKSRFWNMFGFNATLNNISVILWRSVLLVEETTDLSQVTDKLYHIMFYTLPWSGVELTTSVGIGTRAPPGSELNIQKLTKPISITLQILWLYKDRTVISIDICRGFFVLNDLRWGEVVFILLILVELLTITV